MVEVLVVLVVVEEVLVVTIVTEDQAASGTDRSIEMASLVQVLSAVHALAAVAESVPRAKDTS